MGEKWRPPRLRRLTPLDLVSAAEPSPSWLYLWPTRMGRTVRRRHAFAEVSSKTVFDDPTAPPSSSKKRAYAVWFLAIQLVEFLIIRKQVRVYGVVEVRSEFILHSQLMLTFVHIVIDVVTLLNLNVLHPSWVSPALSTSRVAPILASQRKTRFWHARSQDGGAHPKYLRVPTLRSIRHLHWLLSETGGAHDLVPYFFCVYFAITLRD